eukprot:SAG31_NODE_20613_length_569_cov_1.308511_1_plen_160_part_10
MYLVLIASSRKPGLRSNGSLLRLCSRTALWRACTEHITRCHPYSDSSRRPGRRAWIAPRPVGFERWTLSRPSRLQETSGIRMLAAAVAAFSNFVAVAADVPRPPLLPVPSARRSVLPVPVGSVTDKWQRHLVATGSDSEMVISWLTPTACPDSVVKLWPA